MSEKIKAAIAEALNPFNALNAGCPDVTPTDLLAEVVTQEDLTKLEQVMGRFTSTTAFLGALKTVLVGLEAGPEVHALEAFIPMMAQVEAGAMNDKIEVTIVAEVSKTERILRILPSDNLVKYPRVENGELLNSGEVSVIDKLAAALCVW